MNKSAHNWFIEDLDLHVEVKRSIRAKRLRLKVSSLDGGVTLTIPPGASDAQARLFLNDHHGWLSQHVSRVPKQQTVALGQTLPFEGRLYHIEQGSARGIHIAEDRLIVGGAAHTAARRIQGFLKTRAHAALLEASEYYAGKLGRPFSKITLRDTRSRWGSCTAQGALMYSWRLIMAPPEILRYVAAHEVAHLAHMDHSPAFWACTEALYGDTRAARHWLKSKGTALHRYRFDDVS